MLARLLREFNTSRDCPNSFSQQNLSIEPAVTSMLAPTLRECAEPVIGQIEQDLHTLINAVQQSSAEVNRSVAQAGASLSDISTRTTALVSETQTVDGTASLLAQAAKELTQASTSISAQIHTAAHLLEQITGVVGAAQSQIEQLRVSSGEIGTVVNVVAGITRQTNLLALNAMIEASRAGEQGRGFAVVAQEVKALASQTAGATEHIRTSIERLQNDAVCSVRTVTEAATLASRIGPRFVEVVAAVEEQIASTAELTRSAEAVARFVHQVVSSASAIQEQAQSASSVSAATAVSSSTVDRLHGRTLVVLRNNALGDRREHPRLPVALPATLRLGGQTYSARAIDVSRGGFLVSGPAELRATTDQEIEVETAELGRTLTRVVGLSALGLHLRITQAPQGYAAAVDRLAGTVNAQNADRIAKALAAAAEIAHALDAALASGRVTEAALFDVSYQPVLGSNPQQYLTPALPLLEALLTPVQERLLASDPRLAFCVAMDRNAYLPVHNRKYAQPQRVGEVAWNTANSRNRRIFDDRAGLMAARSTEPFLVQSYARDMGEGRSVLLQEIDAPIQVAGRHWGGFRMAYST